MSKAKSAEKVVQDIRRKTRRRFSAEETIRIVLEGLRGEESIAALCRREGLNPNLYDRWSKEGIVRLTLRPGTSRHLIVDGIVKLSRIRLTDPQDDGLESCREPGMLGVDHRDSA